MTTRVHDSNKDPMLLQDVAFNRAVNTMRQYWQKMMQIVAWLRSTSDDTDGPDVMPIDGRTVLTTQKFMELMLAEELRRSPSTGDPLWLPVPASFHTFNWPARRPADHLSSVCYELKLDSCVWQKQ